MFNENNSRTKNAAAGGLVIGLVLSALVYAEYLLHVSLGLPVIIVYVGGIIGYTVKYRDLKGSLTYRQSLAFGVLLSGFAYIVLGFYYYIHISHIDPDGFIKTFNEIVRIIREHSDAPFDGDAVKPVRNPVFIVASHLTAGLLLGLIVSSITSLFTKRK